MAKKQHKPNKRTVLRDFKAKLKILKKAGVTKVNVAKTKPSKYWRTKFRQFDSVLKGKTVPVKLTRAQAKEAGKSHEIVNGFQLVPSVEGAKIRRSKKAPLGYKITYRDGVTSISLPRPRRGETLEQWLGRVRQFSTEQPGVSVGFTLFGNKSHLLFPSMEEAIRNLYENYSAPWSVARGENSWQEWIKGIELYSLKGQRYW